MNFESAKLISSSKELLAQLEGVKFGQPKAEPKEEEQEAPKPFLPELTFGIRKTPWPKRSESERVQIIGFVEQYYFENEELPSAEDFRLHFPDLVIDDDLILGLQAPLAMRGIRAYETPTYLLEPNFVLAVNLMCDPLDRRAPNAKLKEAGLTTRQWKGFLRQKKHKEYYEKAVNDIFDSTTRTVAKQNLTKLVENGDLQAIKYYEERQNIYRPERRDNTQELLVTMLTVTMEILAKHVSAEILQKVALEFQEREILAIETKAS